MQFDSFYRLQMDNPPPPNHQRLRDERAITLCRSPQKILDQKQKRWGKCNFSAGEQARSQKITKNFEDKKESPKIGPLTKENTITMGVSIRMNLQVILQRVSSIPKQSKKSKFLKKFKMRQYRNFKIFCTLFFYILRHIPISKFSIKTDECPQKQF